MGAWSEQYRQAVLGQGSVVRLIGSAMAAVEASGDAALRYRIANERFLAPCVLCEVLDVYGVPVQFAESWHH